MTAARRPVALHLNGVPGVGKSTLARRWVEEHPGTWLLDVDALRTWVGGWRDDFAATGARAWPVALAMASAAAAEGHDLVLPQLLADPGARDRFRDAVTSAGARWVEVVLVAPPEQAARRLAGRGDAEPWASAVAELVAAGGPDLVTTYAVRLGELAAADPAVVVLDTDGLDVAATLAALELVVADVVDAARDRPGPADPR